VVRFSASLERALALALGIDFTASAGDTVLIPGQKVAVRLDLVNGGSRKLVAGFQIPEGLATDAGSPANKLVDPIDLRAGATVLKEIEYEVPLGAKTTVPHSAHIYETSYYPLASALPGLPIEQPSGDQFLAVAEIALDQMVIPVPAIFRYDVAPPIEMLVTPPEALLRDLSSPREIDFRARLINRMPGPFAGSLWVVPLALAREDYEPIHVTFTREDEQVTIPLKLEVPLVKAPLSPDVLIEFRPEKPAAPKALASARIPVRSAGVEVPEGLSVGLIRGPGYSLESGLRELGVAAFDPFSRGIQNENQDRSLARLDAILIDRFALHARPALTGAAGRLLDYVNKGGNLIVLSQRPEDWNALQAAAPALPAIKFQDQPQVIENTPVKILEVESQAMSRPNKLTAADVEGWGLDRALYIPKEWAAEYTPLIELTSGEAESFKGGLLLARVGTGRVVCLSYDWNQALRTMNPGAFRLLANLLSLTRTSRS
jgi:hypothetical protein